MFTSKKAKHFLQIYYQLSNISFVSEMYNRLDSIQQLNQRKPNKICYYLQVF